MTVITAMATSKDGILTAKRARELLRYEPETGKLFWRVNAGHSGRIPAGTEAGSDGHLHYRQVGVDGHLYYAHRLAWLIVTGAWPVDQLDHIDGDGLNNRWCNLRAATPDTGGRNQYLLGLFQQPDRSRRSTQSRRT